MDSGGQTVLENMKEYLLNTIQCTFEVGQDKAERLYEELLECTRHKNMVFIKLYFILSLKLILVVGNIDHYFPNE